MLAHEARRGFATRVCIMAGSKSFDVHGSVIMKNIKALSKEPVEFMGIGGELMHDEGLKESVVDVNTFLNKPFFPYKNFFVKYLESAYHIPTLPTRLRNHTIQKKMKNDKFYEKLMDWQPDVVLTLGNPMFMKHVYRRIAAHYDDKAVLKPPTTFYDSLIIHQLRWHQQFLDHLFYTTPLDAANWRDYVFPSTYIGKWGAARTLAYLYRNSDEYKQLVRDDSLYISEMFNQQVIENLIGEESHKYRNKHNINDTATIIFAMPGNTTDEINFAMPLIHNSINQFMDKFSLGKNSPGVDPKNFVLVIPADSHYGSKVDKFVKSKSWPCKVIVARGDEEKYSAMASSDFGLVMEGDAVSECATVQLPVIIVDKSGFFDTYFKLMYNSFSNDLNIARNGEIYPEIHHGQAHPGKVLDIWSEWYTQPKLRFRYISLYEQYTPKLIPQSERYMGNSIKEAVSYSFNDMTFRKHYFGEQLIAKKMIEAATIFKKNSGKVHKLYQLPLVRKNMMEEINPEFAYLEDDYLARS